MFPPELKLALQLIFWNWFRAGEFKTQVLKIGETSLLDLIPYYYFASSSLDILPVLLTLWARWCIPKQGLWTCYHHLEKSYPRNLDGSLPHLLLVFVAISFSLLKIVHFIENCPLCITLSPPSTHQLPGLSSHFIHRTHYHMAYCVLCIYCFLSATTSAP